MHSSAESSFPADERAISRQLDILVLDDDPLLRDVIARLLQRRGHRVHQAADVAGALDLLAAVRMDAAVVDLGVPGDGVNVLRYLEGDPRFTGVVVAITGRIDTDSDAAFGPRVIHLHKPFRFQVLAPLLEGQGV